MASGELKVQAAASSASRCGNLGISRKTAGGHSSSKSSTCAGVCAWATRIPDTIKQSAAAMGRKWLRDRILLRGTLADCVILSRTSTHPPPQPLNPGNWALLKWLPGLVPGWSVICNLSTWMCCGQTVYVAQIFTRESEQRHAYQHQSCDRRKGNGDAKCVIFLGRGLEPAMSMLGSWTSINSQCAFLNSS